MDLKENDCEYKEIEESKDLIKLPIIKEAENYLLKIFPSKDNLSIIFKLEKEKIKTYYYFGKFYFSQLQQINKKFNSDNSIINTFLSLKEITKNYICSLEKNSLIIKVLFKKNKYDSNNIIFLLKKKIVNQNILNLQLSNDILENKSKIKILKKQIDKLDKIIQNKNKLIDKLNNRVIKILNTSNDINSKFIERENLDNIKNISKNIKNKSENSKEKENKQKDENIYKKENELLKQNKEGKKNKEYKINIYKKSNINKEGSIFCLGNIAVLKNKKVYEILISFNIITVLIIIYLYYSFYDLKEEIRNGNSIMKKIAILNGFDESYLNEFGGIRDNVIDFSLKDNDEDNSNINKKISDTLNKSFQENKEISLFTNENEIRYFRKHIRKKIYYRIKGIDLELKYNSIKPYKFRDIYNHYRDISEILVLMRAKNGRRYGLFINNILIRDKYSGDNDKNNDYVAYIFNNSQINEIDLGEFFNDHQKYIQNIYDYLSNERKNIKNKYYNVSVDKFGDIEAFEIYQVKYIK